MENSAERKRRKSSAETKEYRVNVVYGDKALVKCMENVIRRLLVKAMEAE